VHRNLLHKSVLYWLCLGASLILLAARAHPPAPRRGLRWLARMGALSYELYLSHMFIVLATVGTYRALLGKNQSWTFTVYLPVLIACYALAVLLERAQVKLDELRRRRKSVYDVPVENQASQKV
jgi:peptidoglycan/LPS O-acetylase OafA/YrhL